MFKVIKKAEIYSEPCHTSKIQLFAKIVQKASQAAPS